MDPNASSKEELFNKLLIESSSVFIHLDPRRDGVVVPAHFRNRPMLVLEIGMNMRVPIPDLGIDEEGVECTLSFGGRPFWCRMPWSSVFALRSNDHNATAWPNDVPPEMAESYGRPTPAQPKAHPPILAVVKGGSQRTDKTPTETPTLQPTPNPTSTSTTVARDTASPTAAGQDDEYSLDDRSADERLFDERSSCGTVPAEGTLVDRATPTMYSAKQDESADPSSIGLSSRESERQDQTALQETPIADGTGIPEANADHEAFEPPELPNASKSGKAKRKLPAYLRVVR